MSVNKWNRVDNRGNGLLIEKFEVEEIKAVVWDHIIFIKRILAYPSIDIGRMHDE